MKKILFFIHLIFVVSCKSDSRDPKPLADSQTLELIANGKTNQLNTTDDVITSAFGGSQFSLSGLSEKNDLSFTVLAYMASLKNGDYKAYTCLLPSECDDQDEKLEGDVILQPYPTGSIDISTARLAYHAPSLNLEPLTLSVSEVKDEQQAGNPLKTKKVKGSFSGTLAYVQQQSDNTWIVVKTTAVSGSFEVYCSIY